MNRYDNNGIVRVSKSMARRLYNAGKAIYLLPCKVRFENMWIKPVRAVPDELTTIGTSTGFDTVVARNKEFETVVNCFEYYNCNNELGRYTAFYTLKGV